MKSRPNEFSNPSIPGHTMEKSVPICLFSLKAILARSIALRRTFSMGLLSAPNSNCRSKNRFGTMVMSRMPVCSPNST